MSRQPPRSPRTDPLFPYTTLSRSVWSCAACWRYALPELEAGVIAPRDPFYRGYEAVSGQRIDPEVVAFWEIMAHLRWAVIALQQGERTLSGGEDSLELALTGRVYPPALEAEILRQTAPARWQLGRASCRDRVCQCVKLPWFAV